jgi:protein-tyrosine phosphatase
MIDLFEIIPGKLWQSGAPSAPDWSEIRALGMQCVVDLAGELGPVAPAEFDSLLFVFWPIDDGPLPDLSRLEDISNLVVEQVKAGWKCLSHCAAGINRSGLVNAMVVRQLLKLSGHDAIAYIRAHREGALSNPAFVQYLESLPKP